MEWASERGAVREWAERARTAWLVGSGVDAVLGLLAEGGAGPEAVVARLEAVLEQGRRERDAATQGVGVHGADAGKAGAAPRQRAAVPARGGRAGAEGPAAWEGTRSLSGERYVVLFLGAATVRGAWATMAVGVLGDGSKRLLGLWRGCTADAVVARGAVEDLARRGLGAEVGLLVVHDGSPALDEAVGAAWGSQAAVAHCERCAEREVLGHLAEKHRAPVRALLRRAWSAAGPERRRHLQAAVDELGSEHPGAAARLRRSLGALCTVSELGVPVPLRLHLEGLGPVRQLADEAERAKGSGVGPAAIAAVLPAVSAGMRRLIGHAAMPQLAEGLARRAAGGPA